MASGAGSCRLLSLYRKQCCRADVWFWTTACQNCSLKSQCTTGQERRITRWEHEHLLEAVLQRLDSNPQAMRQLRETVEHPFGTMKGPHGSDTLPHQNAPK